MYKGERINSISHLTGACLSFVGMIFLLVYSIRTGDVFKYISCSIYGITLFLMYLFSTIYHSTKGNIKKLFQIFDHSAIYLLIAGTYTPFSLVTLRESRGYLLLSVVWTIAVIGIGLKIIWKDKYDLLSTIGYLIAGWLILLDIKAFTNGFQDGFIWILVGGIMYSIGAVFYLWEKFPFNHEIWHFFVLFASASHFIGIFYYLI